MSATKKCLYQRTLITAFRRFLKTFRLAIFRDFRRLSKRDKWTWNTRKVKFSVIIHCGYAEAAAECNFV